MLAAVDKQKMLHAAGFDKAADSTSHRYGRSAGGAGQVTDGKRAGVEDLLKMLVLIHKEEVLRSRGIDEGAQSAPGAPTAGAPAAWVRSPTAKEPV